MKTVSALILALFTLLPTAHATLSGPDQIKRCPGVESPLRFDTFISGSTITASIWTDGKMEAPMLPANPAIWKAGPQELIFWEESCELLEQVGYGATPSMATQEPLPLEEDDFYRALVEGLGDTPEREEYLRLLTWWASNDRFRHGSDATLADREPQAMANMEALYGLLDENADQSTRISKAELARQLGNFDAAAALLDHRFSRFYVPAVERIRALTGAGEVMVREIRDTP